MKAGTRDEGSGAGRPSARGFTLLEIMIALAIIGITLSVVLHTVNYHADILYRNTVTTHMYQAAKEKMHELEESRLQAQGMLDAALAFETRVTKLEDSDIVELKTTVTGYDREVSLVELVIDARREEQR